MTKVLVTGAYGFLGKYVVRELKEHGYYVIAFGRKRERLNELKEECDELAEGDICDLPEIMNATRGVDYVIHCAALLKGWGRREAFIRTNVEGTRNVLLACEKNKVKRLVYTSSPSAYAIENNFFITEDDYNKGNKLNYYIESKILAEELVRSQNKVPFSIIRPRGLCGIGDENMLPVLINANKTIGIPLFQKGKVVVDLTCIENVALSLRLCMESENAVGQVYNITNGEPKRLTELAENMFHKLGMPVKYRKLPFGIMYGLAGAIEGVYKAFNIYDKAPAITRYNICTLGKSQVFDITKAQQELGYQPRITLDEMIDLYAEWYCMKMGITENQDEK